VVPCNAILDGCLHGQTSVGCMPNKPPLPPSCRPDSVPDTMVPSSKCGSLLCIAFSALTVLVGHPEEHLACKKIQLLFNEI